MGKSAQLPFNCTVRVCSSCGGVAAASKIVRAVLFVLTRRVGGVTVLLMFTRQQQVRLSELYGSCHNSSCRRNDSTVNVYSSCSESSSRKRMEEVVEVE